MKISNFRYTKKIGCVQFAEVGIRRLFITAYFTIYKAEDDPWWRWLDNGKECSTLEYSMEEMEADYLNGIIAKKLRKVYYKNKINKTELLYDYMVYIMEKSK